MATAKDIIIKPIKAAVANRKCKEIHYSGKVVNNSRLHFGVFLNGKLEGVMQLGCSIDIRRSKGLVADTGWNDFIELNRMAFSDALPKFSESRAISIVMKIIKKNYPNIKWVLSFADGTQCGDGTIYRASGFYLTGIKKNTQMLKMPNGDIVAKKSLDNPNHRVGGRFGSSIAMENGAKRLLGFQLRYVYFIDKSYKEKLTVPILPFSKIDEMGAGMYKGVARDTKANSGDQLESGGAVPTITLQSMGKQNATEA
jgi:hypothetical protein